MQACIEAGMPLHAMATPWRTWHLVGWWPHAPRTQAPTAPPLSPALAPCVDTAWCRYLCALVENSMPVTDRACVCLSDVREERNEHGAHRHGAVNTWLAEQGAQGGRDLRIDTGPAVDSRRQQGGGGGGERAGAFEPPRLETSLDAQAHARAHKPGLLNYSRESMSGRSALAGPCAGRPRERILTGGERAGGDRAGDAHARSRRSQRIARLDFPALQFRPDDCTW